MDSAPPFVCVLKQNSDATGAFGPTLDKEKPAKNTAQVNTTEQNRTESESDVFVCCSAVFSDFGSRLLDSPVVLCVIVGLFLLYLLLLVWARRADKNDRLKVGASYTISVLANLLLFCLKTFSRTAPMYKSQLSIRYNPTFALKSH